MKTKLKIGDKVSVETAKAIDWSSIRDDTSANYVGDIGVGADPALVAKAKQSDLILAFGTRIGEPVSDAFFVCRQQGKRTVRVKAK